MSKKAINVHSEIGKLKTVLVHRPGHELSNLHPDYLERLLFDDTPDLDVAQKEHDAFTDAFRKCGVEVLYIEKLATEALDNNPLLREDFITQYIDESGAPEEHKTALKNYLEQFNNQDLINKMIAGVTKFEMAIEDNEGYALLVDPLPNILFQRDPFVSLGNSAVINKMTKLTRQRETLFSDLVLKEHPRFKDNVDFLYNRNDKEPIEGGDVLVLNKEVVMIGCTERTTIDAIRTLAKRLFNSEANTYKTVYVVDLKTKNRSFMHLDTVFTHIDYDKFIVHPVIFESSSEFKIIKIQDGTEEVVKKPLVELLSDELGKEVKFIKCGGDDSVNQAREQWNDGTNVVTISPGEVIAYSRNHITLELLKEAGVKCHIIPSSELSRGRGGPRCMSMPIVREEI